MEGTQIGPPTNRGATRRVVDDEAEGQSPFAYRAASQHAAASHAGCGFNMSADESARKSMIDWLWAGDYNDSVTEMSSANPDLHARLVSNTRNYSYTPSPSQVWRSERRLNFLTGLLTRNRNVNVIPKDQVLLAIQAKVRKCLTLPCPRLVPASCVQCVLLTAACSVVVACSTKTPTRNFGKT